MSSSKNAKNASAYSPKHFIQYLGTRFALVVVSLLPIGLRRSVVRAILRVVAKFLGRHRNIALRNLTLAFPEMSKEQKEKLFIESFSSLADLIVDLARFPTLSTNWAENQIEFPSLPRLKEVKEQDPAKGILLVTGHLGSFELSAYCLPFIYRPISFLVRNFSNEYLDSWWKKLRERNGNSVVSREGGYKSMVRLLQEGVDVGVLFDQNVTRNHAIFVDWFGRPAATTKALAMAALRTEAPVFVVALIVTGADNYFYECIETDCSDIYGNEALSKKEKLLRITERLVRQWEQLVLKYPESWFWMHRRWKTTPEGEAEDFYNGC